MATIEPQAGAIHMTLDAEESRMLRNLLDEMKIALQEEGAMDDAVVERLFPAAYADPDDARAFSDLVGDELKAGKLQALENAAEALGESGDVDLVLQVSEVDPWLTLLTDLRLAIGTRAGVTEETMEGDLDPSTNPDAPVLALLHWLGWMQESLLEGIRVAE